MFVLITIIITYLIYKIIDRICEHKEYIQEEYEEMNATYIYKILKNNNDTVFIQRIDKYEEKKDDGRKEI